MACQENLVDSHKEIIQVSGFKIASFLQTPGAVVGDLRKSFISFACHFVTGLGRMLWSLTGTS